MAQGQVTNQPPAKLAIEKHRSSLPSLPWRTRLQYSYLLRVPIVIGLTLFAFPILSIYEFRQLLGNLFVVGPWNIFWTVFATELLALGILVVIRVVLLNGEERFGIPQGLLQDVVRKKSIFLPQILIVPMFVTLIFSNNQVTQIKDGVIRGSFGLGAILAALVTAFAALWISVLFSPRYPNPNQPADPEHPAHQRFCLPFEFMRKWIDWASAKDWSSPAGRAWVGRIVVTWPKSITAGYFDPKTFLPYPGQVLTFLMLILSSSLYELIGYFKHARLGLLFGVPAIAYIVVLLIVLNWLLSVASFFLDYFLLPLLLPGLLFVLSANTVTVPFRVSSTLQPFMMAAVIITVVLAGASFFVLSLRKRRRLFVCMALLSILLANLLSDSDHFYEIRPAAPDLPTVTPTQVLQAPFRLNPDKDHPNGRITVIATAGGGIQAAAWTARVLTGLQEEVKSDSSNRTFANSIAAISSVSGGAVGTLFFVSRYQTAAQTDPGFPLSTDLGKVVDDAQTPALGDVAWAMVYPDLTRALIPFYKRYATRLVDRGWALEQAWRRRLGFDATLGDWRKDVSQGLRPAVIFNSTIVESGEPFLLATTDLKEPEFIGSRTLPSLLPGYDIPVVTAVRLAASFPFVSPASRALYDPHSETPRHSQSELLEQNSKYHVVDGGYYDNYGIDGLLRFLELALTPIPRGKAPDILIVQIRSFPSENSPSGQSEGWFYQGTAPLSALLQVRTTAQLLRDRESLNNFVALWSDRGVNIRLATFEFPGDNAPLSWQMNQPQINAIQTEWKKRIAAADNNDWLQVSCFFHPGEPACEHLSQLIRKGAW